MHFFSIEPTKKVKTSNLSAFSHLNDSGNAKMDIFTENLLFLQKKKTRLSKRNIKTNFLNFRDFSRNVLTERGCFF